MLLLVQVFIVSCAAMVLLHVFKARFYQQKWTKILFHVLRIIAFLFLLLPIVIWGSAIIVDLVSNTYDEDYVDTGTMIRWTKEYESFTYDGNDYERLGAIKLAGKTYDLGSWMTGDDAMEKKPEFNIAKKRSIGILALGLTERTNVYKMKSESGYDLYYSTEVFGKKADLKNIKAYYEDSNHYNFYLEDFSGEDLEEDLSDVSGFQIKLTEKEWKALSNMGDQEQTDLAWDPYEEDDSEIEGYCTVNAVSKDHVVGMEAESLFKENGVWYIYGQDRKKDGYMTAGKIPQSIADKIEKTEKESL
jgi:hypothetical protein